MSSFPITFAESAKALPIQLNEQHNAASAVLAEKGFIVVTGLTRQLAGEVALMGAQPHIREYCPKDPTTKRFGTLASTEAWLAKGDDKLRQYGRGMFLLAEKVDEEDLRLAGYGWTGPELSDKVPGGETTFAVRIGQADLGKGLAVPFSRLIVEGTAELYDAQDIWLETWKSNHAAGVYQKVGFELVPDTETPAMRPTLTQEGDIADARLYMSFPNDLLG